MSEITKIFLESHNIKNLNFGFGQFNHHLIKAIHELQPKDIDITLHAKDIPRFKTEFGSTFSYKKYKAIRRYPFFRIRQKYALWHSLNQNTKIEPFHPVLYVLTVHNISHIIDETDYKNEKNNIAFQEKLNRSHAITYISEYAKASTHKYFEVPNVPEYVIYNGNTISEIEVTECHIPQVPINRPYLFSIGEFTERKNFQTLVSMLQHLPDYDLVLAGKKQTNHAEIIQETIDKLELNNRVHLVGKISELDKQYYYKNCDAFVFPSLREGFGLPVIEAMRFGKPVFLSNNTSLPEIGLDIAFYWDHFTPEYMADIVMQGLTTFNSNKAHYVASSIKHSQSFCWKNAAKEYIEVYRQLLAKEA